MLSWRSEDLGMTLKGGKAWGLLIPLSIHSFIQQTFRKTPVVCQALPGWLRENIRRDSIKISRQKEL